MKIIQKAKLLILVVYISGTFLLITVMCLYHNKGSERQLVLKVIAPPSASLDHSCQSLFTITNWTSVVDTLNKKWMAPGSRGSYISTPTHIPPHITTVNHPQSIAPIHIPPFTPPIYHTIKPLDTSYSSTSIMSTGDYRVLSLLLPPLVTFQHNSSVPHPDVPWLTSTSRIDAKAGVLPYVPCTIVPYDRPSSVTTCLTTRLQNNNNNLTLHFMGDSKIREIFYQFLHRTDTEYHYTVKLPNTTVPFAGMRETYVKEDDMVATTTRAPGLYIIFSFRTFSDLGVEEMRRSQEVEQLRRWAEGREAPPPHLLVIGYSSWTLQRQLSINALDALDVLAGTHSVVAPLLDRIGHKTRVLVVPQHRHRPNAGIHSWEMAYRDTTFDWSERTFLYYLTRHRQQHVRAPSRNSLDYGGLWWWDTSLPLGLAGIEDCHQLYQKGFTHHHLYTRDFLKCTDGHHAGTSTLDDQITMLLNMMCNGGMKTKSDTCCRSYDK